MIILSHRGFWLERGERNMRAAFVRSFDAGYGTETDLRDICGKIVIAHDMPRGDEMSFEELLQIMDGRNLPLALNIKADGQAEKIKDLLEKYQHTNYFTFDMSIPDMRMHIAAGLNVFTGQSDLIREPILLDKCTGVWLDAFESDWYDAAALDDIVEKAKQVCIVSDDLHQRDNAYQWAQIKQSQSCQGDYLMLCTDKPDEAKEYFYGKN